MVKHLSSRQFFSRILIFFVVLVVAAISFIFLQEGELFLVRAAGVAWDGGGDGTSWSDGDNWDNDTVPTAVDDVTIDANVTVNIDASTTINSLTLGNGSGTTSPTLNFSYDAIAGSGLVIDDGNLTVHSNAEITHSPGTSVVVGTIYIDVQTGSATIDGAIDVDAKGYDAQDGPGAGATPGWGSGASYGGEGGVGGDGVSGANTDTYGSITAPTALGSGGGYVNGGSGGGAVRLDVNAGLDIDGTITADGADAGTHGGGGSGGSIYFTVGGTLTGDGSISADGGQGSTNGAGGGGGRIAIYYTTDSSTISEQAYGGAGAIDAFRYGGAGTIYLKASGATNGDLVINNNGLTADDDYFQGRTTLTPAGSSNSFTFDNFTVQGYGNLELNSDTTISVVSTLTWNSNGVITDRGGVLSPISGGGTLTIPSGALLFADTDRSYSSVTVNGTLRHSGNLAAHVYDIDYDITGNFTVSSGGVIDVDAKGYDAQDGPGAGATPSWGSGASYGGEGGVGEDGAPGANTDTYGSITAPTALGSGGGYVNGGSGGGAVLINVDGAVDISGTITADGADAGTHGGGGSGGSVYIKGYLSATPGTLTGDGSISADGGQGSTNGAGGGGGRIAIYYTTDSSTISEQAYGGAGAIDAFRYGGAGTIYLKASGATNGDLVINNNGLTADTEIFAGYTTLTPVGTPLSVSYDTLTVQNRGWLDVNTSTTISYSALSWGTSGIIADNGGVIPLVAGGSNVTIPAGAILHANTAHTGGGAWNSLTINGTLSNTANYDSAANVVDIETVNDVTISSGGSVDVTSKGFFSGQGPGLGTDPLWAGGSGHGGVGGDSLSGATGGPTYGSSTSPVTLGTGATQDDGNQGSNGGGAVKLTVGGDLDISGTIIANAGPAVGPFSGGASGGSIWLVVTGAVTGSGNITANGGDASTVNNGAGGGGRVAITCSDGQSWGSAVSVLAGTIGYAAGAGTYEDNCSTSVPPAGPEVTLSVDNEAPQVLAGTEKMCDNSTPIGNSDAAITACSNLSAVNLIAGSTLPVSLFVKVRDPNGSSNVAASGHTGAYYHSTNASPATQSCSSDNNNCYQLSGVRAAIVDATDAWVRYDFNLQYYTDDSPGGETWLGFVNVLDAASLSDDNAGGEYSNDINSLISVTFPDVAFGGISLPFTSTAANNIEITHQNNGNVIVDIDVSLTSASLSCSVQGSIPVSAIGFATSDVARGSMTTLTEQPTNVNMDIDIAQRVNDSAPQLGTDQRISYWGITLASGASGVCSSTLNVISSQGP